MRVLVVLALVAGCSVESSGASRPPPLGPLPPPAPADTERFRDAEACGQCHLVDDTATIEHDATGANISPLKLWRSSLMALAARDPYYLAVVSEELSHAPAQRASIETLCLRCHAPAGSEELAATGQHLGFDELTSGTSPAAVLGRGGVTCTACHQIDPANLGDERSFTGGFSIGYQRKIYGRYSDPSTSPMMLIVNYQPTLGSHIESSTLCATCHTVIVPGGSGEVVEQATFLEWRSSEAATKGVPCQGCHVPTVDDLGQAIATTVASFPAGLPPRTPVGRHTFVGGNSYMLGLLADAVDWSGAAIPAAELTASAARDDAHLATAARVTIPDLHREGSDLVAVVRVENLAGHKLPTGYPSRRLWLHATVRDGDQLVFESGRANATGAIVDARGAVLPPQPHRDTITAPDEVQVWEAVLVDAGGEPTHRALDARRYGKDDRILPAGFAPSSSSDRTRTQPVGTSADASFVAGHDDVTFRIAGAPATATFEVELLYEAIRPDIVDAVDLAATPAATRFVDLARARPVQPVALGSARRQ